MHNRTHTVSRLQDDFSFITGAKEWSVFENQMLTRVYGVRTRIVLEVEFSKYNIVKRF